MTGTRIQATWTSSLKVGVEGSAGSSAEGRAALTVKSAKTAREVAIRPIRHLRALVASTGGGPTVNIRDISIKCGNCDSYQTLTGFARREEWNVYTYECDHGRCDPALTRTLVEVPRQIDEFARRDPEWRGGGKHGEFGSGSPAD